MSKKSYFEEQVFQILKETKAGLPGREFRFHPERKFRFDFAYPELMLAVECEGGVWSRGRHTRGSGFIKDCEKYNLACRLGWNIFRYTPDMIEQIMYDVNFFISQKKAKNLLRNVKIYE